jgi:DedD protein
VEGPVKERLTGALILVAALVIIVPEMLSGPEPESASASALAQPADTQPPLRTYSMTLDGSADPHEAVQSALAPQPSPVESSAVEPALPPAAEPPVASAEPPVPAVTEPAPAAQEPPKPATSAPSPAGRWWTQLGSFSSRDNADRLASQLRAAGFAIDVTQVKAGGKELYRVRAGPVRDRGEALTLQSRLAAAGNKSSIVAP